MGKEGAPVQRCLCRPARNSGSPVTARSASTA